MEISIISLTPPKVWNKNLKKKQIAPLKCQKTGFKMA